MPLKRFVAEEIARPLGADFQIGAAKADWDRIAPDSPMYKTFTSRTCR
jgi:hypothetical protein